MTHTPTQPTVLIVDDDQAYRETIARALSLRQVTVLTAADFRTACNLIDTEPVSVAVFDYSVQGANGDCLCKKILKVSPSIAMIILSAQQSSLIEKKIRSCSPIVYLIKPVVIEELCAVVDRCLRAINQNVAA